ncbi:AGC protein kinase [Saprolegnia parasitica CBS 223.65]|uniref:non-specific serine/threonine protein kinase n=1 Tax=Saprolegnia parasitica (strain CBS 223.65) TaxID=695850 RepID=A0A067BMP2_SAPPC|nr:AGC protein kinase [Saprolegnia parasitica CBS 223.65]KDO18020.1 AGC protein kinase [Saprolegnia parasitica CBS 223.65]|eukprot:XP_012211272.1 AGC protein kinase [Saprolegnia parasitica CBS 223.65]
MASSSSSTEYEAMVEDLIPDAQAPGAVCLEDFSLIRVIGKGSFGKVTLVRKKDNSKVFAMKILNKAFIIKRNQVEHTRTERKVLAVVSHPFIVSLHYAFQTNDKLYFVLDYCPGGELFFHLTRLGKFTEAMARFYSAELVVALEHLHSLGVVYRDLKPENILLDELGHYLAPEVLARKGHGTAVDWWGLGMVLFEMLTGMPPWYTRNRQDLYARIRDAPLEIPHYVSHEAASLIRALLHRDPDKRLGGVKGHGAANVKAHPFFASVDWDGLLWAEPPFHPNAKKDDADTSNFEKEFTEMPVHTPVSLNPVSAQAIPKSMFNGFTYEAPSVSLGSNSSQSKVEAATAQPFI